MVFNSHGRLAESVPTLQILLLAKAEQPSQKNKIKEVVLEATCKSQQKDNVLMRDQKATYQRWYAKLKLDPVRYARMLEKGRAWNAKNRKEKPPAYYLQVERRREKRRLNPFAHRERNRNYYHYVKTDNLAYRAMLTKQRNKYRERIAKLKSIPGAYEKWRHEKMVYYRYYRIIKKNKELIGI